MPAGQEVADGTAVAGNQSLEAPFVAQYLLFVAGLRTAGLSVDTLVGAHHLGHLAFLHQGFEGGEIGLPEVTLWQVLYIKGMAVPLRAAVYGIVLGAGEEFAVFAHTEVFAVVAHTLQAAHHGEAHLRGEVGVFAVGLLAASPAGVTEDIDVRCPERQALVALDISRLFGLTGFYTGLVADSGEDLVQQGVVPRGCHGHRDGEDGGIAVAPDAVQGLVPPLELRDAESLDGGRCVHHQTHFLFKCQSAEQVVSTLAGCQVGVLIRQLLSACRQGADAHRQDD